MSSAFRFSTILDALFDRMGVTTETALAVRMANAAKDKFLAFAKWPYLQSEVDLAIGNSVRAYTLGTDVQAILAIHDSTGLGMDSVERVTYDMLYRNNTAAADLPTVFTREDFETTAAPKLHFWKTPQVTSTCKVRHTVRVDDLADTTSTSAYNQIPGEHYIGIIELAEAMLHEYEDSPQAPILIQKAQITIAALAGQSGAPLLVEGIST